MVYILLHLENYFIKLYNLKFCFDFHANDVAELEAMKSKSYTEETSLNSTECWGDREEWTKFSRQSSL